jgi:hypothetical protein
LKIECLSYKNRNNLTIDSRFKVAKDFVSNVETNLTTLLPELMKLKNTLMIKPVY